MKNSIYQYEVVCEYAAIMLTEEELAIFIGELFKCMQKKLFYIRDNKLYAKWNAEDKLGYKIAL